MLSITQGTILYIGFVIAAYVAAARFAHHFYLPRSTRTSIYGFLFVILFWSTLSLDIVIASALQVVELWIWAEADPRLHQAVANAAPIAAGFGVVASAVWFLKERRRISIDDETDYIGGAFLRVFAIAFCLFGYLSYEGRSPIAFDAFNVAFLTE